MIFGTDVTDGLRLLRKRFPSLGEREVILEWR
jgi:hypothetical protein